MRRLWIRLLEGDGCDTDNIILTVGCARERSSKCAKSKNRKRGTAPPLDFPFVAGHAGRRSLNVPLRYANVS